MVRAAGAGKLAGRVELIESLGADTLIHTTVGHDVQIVARQAERTSLTPGDVVGLDIAPASFHLFDRQGHTVAVSTGAR